MTRHGKIRKAQKTTGPARQRQIPRKVTLNQSKVGIRKTEKLSAVWDVVHNRVLCSALDGYAPNRLRLRLRLGLRLELELESG